jgi:hydroxypyruvate reductase
LRGDAVDIFRAGVEAADPRRAVAAHAAYDGKRLTVHTVQSTRGEVSAPVPEPGEGQVLVVGAGKGSAPMAQALEEMLGDRISGGLVCVKDGHGVPLQRIEIREASHPVPDQRGVEAAGRILEMVQGGGENDLVLCVISGGGSALLTLPAEGMNLEDLRGLTDQLLACGASIDEINTLRKHVSRVKGGRLAQAAHPATVVNLVLSDVVGDSLDVIASGPLSADPTTFADAREILERYEILERIPESVRRVIDAGGRGEVPETPKPGDVALDKVIHSIVGSNERSLQAAAAKAAQLGYQPLILSSLVEGEAREVARVLAAIAKQCRVSGVPVAPPACVLAGGETTVTLKGDGLGGRNQELALALALELEGWPGIVGLSGGTDGTDGPTDAAGAVASHETIPKANTQGLDPRRYLAENDSYHFFDALGDLIRTGPTRTNVMDIQALLVGD